MVDHAAPFALRCERVSSGRFDNPSGPLGDVDPGDVLGVRGAVDAYRHSSACESLDDIGEAVPRGGLRLNESSHLLGGGIVRKTAGSASV